MHGMESQQNEMNLFMARRLIIRFWVLVHLNIFNGNFSFFINQRATDERLESDNETFHLHETLLTNARLRDVMKFRL